jgi:alpha-beta hydrolase superfamily lysophospholipase
MPFEKPIIVIIPGAFHKPHNYRLLIEPLRSQGYEVLSVPLAVTGDSVRANLDQHDDARVLLAELVPKLDESKEAILISHSYGSLVVAASIEGQTTTERQARGLKGGVRAVINIAGFAYPARGKNIFGTDDEHDPMPYWLIEVS